MESFTCRRGSQKPPALQPRVVRRAPGSNLVLLGWNLRGTPAAWFAASLASTQPADLTDRPAARRSERGEDDTMGADRNGHGDGPRVVNMPTPRNVPDEAADES